MKRRNFYDRRALLVKPATRPNTNKCKSVAVSPLAGLLVDENEDTGALVFTSDISIVLNQKRFEKLGITTQSSLVDAINSNRSPVTPPSVSATDEQLFELLKPRRIQSASDYDKWFKYLDGLADEQRNHLLDTFRNLNDKYRSTHSKLNSNNNSSPSKSD